MSGSLGERAGCSAFEPARPHAEPLAASVMSSKVPRARALKRTLSCYHARPLRAACALLYTAALATSVACAETAQGPLAGASDAWRNAPEPTSAPVTEAPQRAWDGYGEVLRMPSVTSQSFTSRGHLPLQSVDVRVNDVARAHYTALVADTVFPNGSVLAELSRNANGNGFVMRKEGGHWSYFELDSRGSLLVSGPAAWCAGCHAQAPSDHVFGLPRGL